jgi:hypothetical protein
MSPSLLSPASLSPSTILAQSSPSDLQPLPLLPLSVALSRLLDNKWQFELPSLSSLLSSPVTVLLEAKHFIATVAAIFLLWPLLSPPFATD